MYLLQVKHDPDTRSSKLADVLKHVRLALVDPYFLFDKLDLEPLLSHNLECRQLFNEAKRYIVLKVSFIELHTLTKN